MLQGSLNKFLIRNQNVSENSHPVSDPPNTCNDSVENNHPVNNPPNHCDDPIFENDEFVDKDEPNEINIFNPRVWDGLNLKMKDLLIEKGSNREFDTNTLFPKDAFGRHFSLDFFVRKLRNGDFVIENG